MASAGKREREVLTLEAEREILERLEPSLMQEFNCEKSTRSHIKKNKDRILSYISTMETAGGAKKRKTLKKESLEDVEKATYLWFLQECGRGTHISGPILAEKAQQTISSGESRVHG